MCASCPTQESSEHSAMCGSHQHGCGTTHARARRERVDRLGIIRARERDIIRSHLRLRRPPWKLRNVPAFLRSISIPSSGTSCHSAPSSPFSPSFFRPPHGEQTLPAVNIVNTLLLDHDLSLDDHEWKEERTLGFFFF